MMRKQPPLAPYLDDKLFIFKKYLLMNRYWKVKNDLVGMVTVTRPYSLHPHPREVGLG